MHFSDFISRTSVFIFFSLIFVSQVSAWGSLGHRTVAYLASIYLTPSSTHFVNSLLNGQDVSEAALFADKVRHMPMFSYSAAWHYIDAQDDPPRWCGVNVTRDCLAERGGCIVSAIANQTSRVVDKENKLTHAERGQSLRFVIHFVGDVHQPLHTEAEERGGNEIPVLFAGRHTNLHSVWDTLIPNHIAAGVGETELEDAWIWASKLYKRAEEDDTVTTEECVGDATECSLLWAGEANRWVCDYVLENDIAGLTGDLAGKYYDGAVPVVEEMIGKAGRRLGAWINMMAEARVSDALEMQVYL